MPDERTICIKNSGSARVSIIINFRGEGYTVLDLEPGNTLEAVIGDRACVALDDVQNVATYGQHLPFNGI